MSSPKQTSGDVNFHPEFTMPADGIVFEASDRLCFRFDVSVLAIFSSFFSDLKTFPSHKSGSKAVVTVAATTPSLAWALRAIKAVCTGSPLPPLPADGARYKIYGEVLAVADAYDLPVLVRALLDATKHAALPGNATQAFDVFTLARIANDKMIVKALSDNASLIHHNALKDMSDWAAKTLRSRDGAGLAALHELNSRWAFALVDFQSAGMSAAQSLQLGTAWRCSCSAMGESGNNFGFFVGRCATTIVAALRRDPTNVLLKFETFCEKELSIRCPPCLDRVVKTLAPARSSLTTAHYTLSL